MSEIRGMRCGKAIAFALLPAFFLTGCFTVGVEETILPARMDYMCAGGKVLQVARSADARAAAVLVDGKEVILQRTPSAAQEKYADGRYALYLEGERAMLEYESTVLFGPCVASVPLPSAPRIR